MDGVEHPQGPQDEGMEELATQITALLTQEPLPGWERLGPVQQAVVSSTLALGLSQVALTPDLENPELRERVRSSAQSLLL